MQWLFEGRWCSRYGGGGRYGSVVGPSVSSVVGPSGVESVPTGPYTWQKLFGGRMGVVDSTFWPYTWQILFGGRMTTRLIVLTRGRGLAGRGVRMTDDLLSTWHWAG